MKTYIGVKIVQAEPEAKDGKDGYKVQYEEGYVSWCPKDVFEKHNRETGGMPFSHALEALKQGKRAARKGWNGKGMWVRRFSRTELPMNCALTHPFLVIEYPEGHPAYPDGSCIPWLASQTDMLSDDWYIVE
jgi:hypothetical protein